MRIDDQEGVRATRNDKLVVDYVLLPTHYFRRACGIQIEVRVHIMIDDQEGVRATRIEEVGVGNFLNHTH
jgi:hypothetical protein